ncbi:MAG: hypothetical protein M1818_000759 [Claussenomyces sp. TS43310]|nr:MAG: hypothetical protein M1818_000759 [Claussenomyces sp. TS43310]
MEPPKPSQEVIDDFWKTFTSPSITPTKASAVLPRNIYAQMVERQVPGGKTAAESVDVSYTEARKHCEAKVTQIIKECLQINQKYCDPYFNLDNKYDCLRPLKAKAKARNTYIDEFDSDESVSENSRDLWPPSVKRLSDIFDAPEFFVEGANAKDIRQGIDGDCWFLSALAALCSLEPARHFINRICVKHDQDVGVYGFLLYRDGEWTSVIVDDKLYLRMADYEDTDEQTRRLWENNRIRVNSQEEYRKEFQTNSRALFYAQSTDPNETWVPLLEKAFAKAHGDYAAIEGGSVGPWFTSEGVEDLTGGISTTIIPSNVLSKDKLWKELLQVNKEFLFGCGTPNWNDPSYVGRDGIHGGHAYSILQAREYNDERLLMVRNPWGESEWNGPWSDGSAQWTAQSIKDLGHTFGDDGVFWIPYKDLLRKYEVIWRTRLFGPEWKVTQQWTSLAVPWAGDYQDAKFEVNLANSAHTAIVLSQLDERYFQGLVGQYNFELSFRIHRAGEEDYIMRTLGEMLDARSASVELDLEAGKYEVRLRITGTRHDKADKVEDVIKSNWLGRRDKLLQTGLSYDLAHAKAQVKHEENGDIDTAKQAGSTTPVKVSVVEVETAKESDAEPSAEKGAGAEGRISTSENAKATNTIVVEPAEDGREEKPDSKEERSYDRDNEEHDEEPWGAVCVVGLRVFCKDADATIQIIRPEKEAIGKPNMLDVDDPARDAANGESKTTSTEVPKKTQSKEVEEAKSEDREEPSKVQKVVEK